MLNWMPDCSTSPTNKHILGDILQFNLTALFSHSQHNQQNIIGTFTIIPRLSSTAFSWHYIVFFPPRYYNVTVELLISECYRYNHEIWHQVCRICPTALRRKRRVMEKKTPKGWTANSVGFISLQASPETHYPLLFRKSPKLCHWSWKIACQSFITKT